tara:strand:- start:1048 stop:2262 length:1215 start_codon:yes stop_codon:yes gene_type:complete
MLAAHIVAPSTSLARTYSHRLALPRMVLNIHHGVSLGPTCSAAEYLRSAGIRQYSLPFDWIHSDVDIVTAVIADGGTALLDRRSLQSSTVRSKTGRKPWQQRCLHRRYRTAAQAHIFNHHDPAACDEDYARLHRTADRLRRVLADHDHRTLFLYLETDAAPGAAHREAFVARAERLFECLRCHTSTFALAAVRAVPMRPANEAAGDERGRPREHELLHAHAHDGGGGADLHVLEMASLTRTVVPFSRVAEQGTPDERADTAALTAALTARFSFGTVRCQPPPPSASTEAARALTGPAWVWAAPPHGPRASASAAELRLALERLRPLGLPSDALPSLGDDEAAVVDVALWAERAIGCGAQPNVREWRSAAKRLATPSRRSPTPAALLATVVGYQLAERSAEGEAG